MDMYVNTVRCGAGTVVENKGVTKFAVQWTLQRFEQFGITVNPDKCSFGLEEVEYVGHTLSSKGMHFKRSKLDGVINFPKPSTKHGMKQFIGLVNYFRGHVRESSTLTAPLEEMVKPYRAKEGLIWTEETETVFNRVKEAVHECPRLWFVDENEKIYVHTDASNIGIGGYMFQVIEGEEKPSHSSARLMISR